MTARGSSRIDRILTSSRIRLWGWINPSPSFRIIRVHFQMLDVLIVISRMPRMMYDGRILAHKPPRIIKTLEPVFVVGDPMPIGRFGLVHVFQMRILHYQLLYCF